jgi:LysM repeat protein
LFRIATRFGIGPDSIKHLNNIGDPSAIKVGQGIWIVCDRSKATP